MPLLPKDESKILKAQIFDLSEQACKQALFGMVEILEQHPSVRLTPFRLMIEDATKYTRELQRGSDGLRLVRGSS